jgi:beta-phosphoglucomutase-like phosphatase (HAD superfamily)
VKTGKPSPEGYLLGREQLGVSDPSHSVVVFEDAVAGVRAGKAAGATVVAMLETASKEELEAAGADHVMEGLHKVQLSPHQNGLLTLNIST